MNRSSSPILSLVLVIGAICGFGVFVILFTMRSPHTDDLLQSQPLALRSAGSGPLFHRLLAEKTGVDFVHHWTLPKRVFQVETHPTAFGGGV